MKPEQATVADAAIRAAVCTAVVLPPGPERWVRAVQATARNLIHRLVAVRGFTLDEGDLPYATCPEADDVLDAVGPLTDWTPLDIGDVHQRFLTLRLDDSEPQLKAVRPRGATGRDIQGAWYTPQPLARATSRLGIEAALRGLPADEPEQVLRLRAVDPACGAGVILIEAADLIAREYARRLADAEAPPPHLVAKVLPEVMYACVFGMDIDPVAIDLTRLALWLAADARPPLSWLDRNIACLNPLDGPNELPPRLLTAIGEATAADSGTRAVHPEAVTHHSNRN